MSGKKVLFVDDDLVIGMVVTMGLQKVGYQTHYQSTLLGINTTINEFKPDVIVLDVEIGEDNAIDAVPIIRTSAPNTPIIFVSSHTQSDFISRAIKEGAAVYIKKPFDVGELIVYIEKSTSSLPASQYLQFGSFELYESDRILRSLEKSSVEHLSPLEYKLLRLLILNKESVIVRKDIYHALFRSLSSGEHSLNNIVLRLRKYISSDETLSIKTIHKVGYKLTEK